jgi:hypothetical protein
MMYCTLVYGKKLHDLYFEELDNFSKTNNLVILTDQPDYFLNSKTILYKRNEFSYYEKLPFILSLVKEHKERVVYFDVDSIDLVKDKNFGFDNKSAYSYKIFKNTDYTDTQLRTDDGLNILCDIYSELGYEMCDYLHERIISIPYSQKIDKMFKEIVKLQPVFEENYSKGKQWKSYDFKRYSKIGCGYGEGGALSIILKNNNINILPLIEKNLI